jgi:hypothetical protein
VNQQNKIQEHESTPYHILAVCIRCRLQVISPWSVHDPLYPFHQGSSLYHSSYFDYTLSSHRTDSAQIIFPAHQEVHHHDYRPQAGGSLLPFSWSKLRSLLQGVIADKIKGPPTMFETQSKPYLAWQDYGKMVNAARPRGLVVVSAHWEDERGSDKVSGESCSRGN